MAPLKQHLRQNQPLSLRVFPRLQKRGPIEAIAPRLPDRSWSVFPRLQKRGPIEAESKRGLAHLGGEVSTLTKAWPH